MRLTSMILVRLLVRQTRLVTNSLSGDYSIHLMSCGLILMPTFFDGQIAMAAVFAKLILALMMVPLISAEISTEERPLSSTI